MKPTLTTLVPQPARMPLALGCGLVAAVLTAAAPAAAQAQTLLQAQAYQYPGATPPAITGSGGVVQAWFPDAQSPAAQAQALLVSTRTSALGTGTAYALAGLGSGNVATGTSSWHYRLWDPVANQALDFGTAFPYDLQFNLRMTGSMSVPADATSRSSVLLSLTVRSYDSGTPGWSFYDDFSDTTIVSYSPFGFYEMAGNAALFGNFDRRVTLYHSAAPEGAFTALASSSASGGGETHANLLLESVTVRGGAWPDNRPVSLRLDDGTLIAVTIAAVPEAPTWLMWCAAAGLAGVRRRRPR